MDITISKRNYLGKIKNYTVLSLAVLVLGGVYGYFQYTNLSQAHQMLADEQEAVTKVGVNVSNFKKDYLDLKGLFDKDFSSLQDTTEAVFPMEENYTELTRKLDDFTDKNNTTTNPMFISDLKFNEVHVEKDKEYATLPFTLTLTTTKENLDKFLYFVENSGSLSNGVRLMDIHSISISFAAKPRTAAAVSGSAQPQILNVSLALNAYFQKPVQTASTKTATK